MQVLVLVALTLFLVCFVIRPIFKLLNNYLIACHIGLPIVITPIGLTDPVWAIIFTLFGGLIEPVLIFLPFGLGRWVRYFQHIWFYKHGHYMHQLHGDVFIIVTPSEIEVVVADPACAEDLNIRRKEFIKEEKMYKPLEIFGPNVDTLNGERWQRHRRFTVPPLNERNSKLVWHESIQQADGMLESWIAKTAKEGAVASAVSDTMTLALHVLQGAGFGRSYPFGGGVSKIADGHQMAYKDALSIILHNIFITVFIKWASLVPSFLAPSNISEIKTAIVEFKKYMCEMIEDEKRLLRRPETGAEQSNNLLSTLVRLSEQEKKATTKGKKGLTDEEIFGNLFFYNLAGHDTTASTLAYAIALLASDLKWQRWVKEELDVVFQGENFDKWEYEKAFPRLKRCLALMFETLRLFGPVPAISKYIENTATITVKGKIYTLPPKTWIPINHAAIHTHPSYWGPDSQIWRPDRWILTNPTSSPLNSTEFSTSATNTSSIPLASTSPLDSEVLYVPKPGQFLPWTSGPRLCPGRKFAQVEFVAVIAQIFRNHEVRPQMLEGETQVEVKERVLSMAKESIVNMTLKMADPGRVKFVWSKLERGEVEVKVTK